MKNKDIYKELMEISPLLASIPDEKPIKLPLGYFEDLEEQILSQISIEKFREASILDLRVPDNYFENLDDKILQKIQTVPATNLYKIEGTNESRFARIKQMTKYWVAASLVVVFSSLILIQYNSEKSFNQNDTVMEDAYLEYIRNNIDDVDISMMIKTKTINESILSDIRIYDMMDPESDDFDFDY
jgi:hypothetical protein